MLPRLQRFHYQCSNIVAQTPIKYPWRRGGVHPAEPLLESKWESFQFHGPAKRGYDLATKRQQYIGFKIVINFSLFFEALKFEHELLELVQT